MLLPLRAFLAVTFLYAGLSSSSIAITWTASSPLGVRSQMLHAAVGSPIGSLVTFSAHHATLVGLMIAFGEMAVGLGTLLGLFTRVAAGLGLLLALSFFLTVSWHHPLLLRLRHRVRLRLEPLLIAGDGGLFSIGRTSGGGCAKACGWRRSPTLANRRP